MPGIQLPPPILSAAVRPRLRCKVSVKEFWEGEWQTAKYLEVLTAVDCASPGVPSARFRWRIGSIRHEDGAAFVTERSSDLRDWWVKVELLGQPSASGRPATQSSVLWVGRFVDQNLELGGTAAGGGAGVAPGDEELVAYGLAYELDRTPIQSAGITNDNETGATIAQVLTFNEDFVWGFGEVGNRSAALINYEFFDPVRKAYAFANVRDASDPQRGYAWTVRQIVEYLLKIQGPSTKGAGGGSSSKPMFTLGGQVQALDQLVYPNVRADGLTVKAVLDELLDRRRGLGWCVRSNGATAEVHVFTTVDEAVSVGDGATLPANAEASDLSVQGLGHLVANQQVGITAGQRYDRIRVTGEPILVCFTVSFQDSTLRIGWNSDFETPYRRAVENGTPEQNDIERMDDRYRDVYTRFLLPADWDWKAGNGEGGAKTLANLACDYDGRLAFPPTGWTTPPIRNFGHTLLRKLPLRVRTPTATDREPEYREMFALVYRPGYGTGANAVPGQYVYADLADVLGGKAAIVRPLDRDFGLSVRFSPNHVLASANFSAATANPTGGGNEAEYDYNKLIATVAARTDTRLNVVVDVTPDSGRPRRTLEIRVPRAEAWYVLKNTVVGIERGQLKRDARTDQERLVRDDSAQLRRVAAMAKAWYGKPRATMSLTLNEAGQQPVGAYVRGLVDAGGGGGGSSSAPPGAVWRAEVNCVVTQVAHDLQRMTTTVRTQFEELDGTEAARQCPGFTIR